jgi:hypothetical protein
MQKVTVRFVDRAPGAGDDRCGLGRRGQAGRRIFAGFSYNVSGYPDWDSRYGDNDFNEFEINRHTWASRSTSTTTGRAQSPAT